MSSKKAKQTIVLASLLVAMSLVAFVPATKAEIDPSPAQQVVNYFIDLFNDDWDIGTNYDYNVDGMGYAQSYDIYGSPAFTPFKRSAEHITDNMTITPILSPINSEDAIIELINSAQESLYIEQMYIYDSLDEILSAIINAHNRGVEVLVIQGDLSETQNNASGNILESAGIIVKRLEQSSSLPYPVPFDTQHNKGVIVDNDTVLVASINWSPTSLRDNREAGLIIESDEVGAYYADLFWHDWNGSVDLISNATSFTPFNPTPNPTLNSFQGEMDVTALACPDNCFDVVNSLLASADESILVSVYTLSSPYLVETLRDRIADGVEVKLLLEKNQVSSVERAYNRWSLMNMTVLGVNVGDHNLTADGRWASTSFDFQHCKYAVIDSKTLILSSGNWGRSSCPKPQTDGDVDGNRDWWFVVYGDGNYVPRDTVPWWVILIASILGIAIGGVAYVQRKRRRSTTRP